MALQDKGQTKILDTDNNLQLGIKSEVTSTFPRSKRKARQMEDGVQLKDSYLDSLAELDDILVKFKKYSKTLGLSENKVFGSSNSHFQSKNERVDTYSFACSSYTDKIEEYLYNPENSFPYKRGVKLVPKENSIYVEASADIDIYGICVDVCEFKCIAYVLPITNNFEGYLVTRNSNIKAGEILDIDDKGVIIKADGGRPTVINAYALSDAFTVNFMLKDENLDQTQYKTPKDCSINLVKVTIFGNKGLDKTLIPKAGGG
ncbi:DUF228 domain-containing protein [Borreliella burgdorferi]|uniref:DUF228 domain-containing protein n=1 Tax=Borreliella burgdorferi TaxID=139 RepID=UPI000D0478E4|nr:DUF228 domain-containing protein [Borreliella burgdorferi]PRR32180.1 hypothetical protein CV693_05410 [Borreliella burgdorferi]